MKYIFSIFLLVATAVYILPVAHFIRDVPGISLKDMANEKEESEKKESSKEFISISPLVVFLPVEDRRSYRPGTLDLPAVFYIIETPPPDNMG